MANNLDSYQFMMTTALEKAFEVNAQKVVVGSPRPFRGVPVGSAWGSLPVNTYTPTTFTPTASALPMPSKEVLNILASYKPNPSAVLAAPSQQSEEELEALARVTMPTPLLSALLRLLDRERAKVADLTKKNDHQKETILLLMKSNDDMTEKLAALVVEDLLKNTPQDPVEKKIDWTAKTHQEFHPWLVLEDPNNG